MNDMLCNFEFPLKEKQYELFEKRCNINLNIVFIEDFNALMYRKTKHKGRKHFCMQCLQNFTSKEILDKHKGKCIIINST